MEKQNLLKSIADTAYNVGFGAKKHFATYDIVQKAPGIISFLSMTVGILALYINELTTQGISSFLIIFGIVGLYISFREGNKKEYDEKGRLLTQLFNELKELYYSVKSSNTTNFDLEKQKLQDIENRYYSNSLSDQIIFSDWYAHLKFFWQHQIDWIDEQKHFSFWRDKIPLSLYFAIFTAFIIIFVYVVKNMLLHLNGG